MKFPQMVDIRAKEGTRDMTLAEKAKHVGFEGASHLLTGWTAATSYLAMGGDNIATRIERSSKRLAHLTRRISSKPLVSTLDAVGNEPKPAPKTASAPGLDEM